MCKLFHLARAAVYSSLVMLEVLRSCFPLAVGLPRVIVGLPPVNQSTRSKPSNNVAMVIAATTIGCTERQRIPNYRVLVKPLSVPLWPDQLILRASAVAGLPSTGSAVEKCF